MGTMGTMHQHHENVNQGVMFCCDLDTHILLVQLCVDYRMWCLVGGLVWFVSFTSAFVFNPSFQSKFPNQKLKKIGLWWG
jgi:hypothetical protein